MDLYYSNLKVPTKIRPEKSLSRNWSISTIQKTEIKLSYPELLIDLPRTITVCSYRTTAIKAKMEIRIS